MAGSGGKIKTATGECTAAVIYEISRKLTMSRRTTTRNETGTALLNAEGFRKDRCGVHCHGSCASFLWNFSNASECNMWVCFPSSN